MYEGGSDTKKVCLKCPVHYASSSRSQLSWDHLWTTSPNLIPNFLYLKLITIEWQEIWYFPRFIELVYWSQKMVLFFVCAVHSYVGVLYGFQRRDYTFILLIFFLESLDN